MTAELWLRLEKTDPHYTKAFTGKGGFSGTAINGTYIIKRLTEEFGPCGSGWKFVLDDERIEGGHVLKSGENARLHIVRGHIDYVLNGQWCSTSPQFGQTFLVSENKYGSFTDEEAPKKSITDCISKCAVLLGIGADVHLGLFDDSKYVNQRYEETDGGEAPAKEVSRPEKAARVEAVSKARSDEAMVAAIKFSQMVCDKAEKFPSREELEKWRTKEIVAKIEKLKDYDIELYNMCIIALNDAVARLS